MILVINIIFYVLGIFLPIIVIINALFRCKKKSNKFKKIIIAVIIFLIFYIIKTGGIYLVSDKKDVNNNKVINNKNITTLKKVKDKDITTTSTTNTTSTTSTTTTSVKETTTKKTETNTKNNNDFSLKIIDGILIVNKSYPLPKDYVPKNTHKDATGLKYCSECIDETAYKEYKNMEADAQSLGLKIWIQSGYRSYELQNDLYTNYVKRDGKLAADTYSARSGHSEHQTGLAFDLNSISDDFQYTSEGKWVNENAWRYGYILRYPKGKEDITGYKFESWHLRYVGKDLAKKLYNDGDWITLEEHFNLKSSYSD